MKIGDWVRRIRVQRPRGRHPVASLTKWHLIDSIVDEEPFLNCGRRLRKRKDTEFETVDTAPLTRMIGQPQLCGHCQ